MLPALQAGRGSPGGIVHLPTATQHVAVRTGWPCGSGQPSLHQTIHLPTCGSWRSTEPLTPPHPAPPMSLSSRTASLRRESAFASAGKPQGATRIRSHLPLWPPHPRVFVLHTLPGRHLPLLPTCQSALITPLTSDVPMEVSPGCSRPFPACLPTHRAHFLGVWISGLSSRLGQYSSRRARGRAEKAARVFPPRPLPWEASNCSGAGSPPWLPLPLHRPTLPTVCSAAQFLASQL